MPIWWMYAGYAWLTNNVRANWQMRLVLIAVIAIEQQLESRKG